MKYVIFLKNGGFSQWEIISEQRSKMQKTVEQMIGSKIQSLRKAKGYTQLKFAEMTGLSANYISDIERGKSSTRLDKLVVIMNVLECSADDLFSEVLNCGYKVKSSRLSERMEFLSPEKRKKIFEILEILF